MDPATRDKCVAALRYSSLHFFPVVTGNHGLTIDPLAWNGGNVWPCRLLE